MGRLSPLVLLLALSPIGASAREGDGRISLQAGWRLTPNDTFYRSASIVGAPKARDSIGGPALLGTFGYMASGQIEVTIDLFAGGEWLHLTGRPPYTSVTYGGVAGARYHWELSESWTLHAGALVGPTLVLITGGHLTGSSESVGLGLMGAAGVLAHLGEGWSLAAEYRLLLIRGWVPGIGTVNGGGSWVGVGFSRIWEPGVRSPHIQ